MTSRAEAIENMLIAIGDSFDREIGDRENRGGQHTNGGSCWGNIGPGTLNEMRRWSRDFRRVLALPVTAAAPDERERQLVRITAGRTAAFITRKEDMIALHINGNGMDDLLAELDRTHPRAPVAETPRSVREWAQKVMRDTWELGYDAAAGDGVQPADAGPACESDVAHVLAHAGPPPVDSVCPDCVCIWCSHAGERAPRAEPHPLLLDVARLGYAAGHREGMEGVEYVSGADGEAALDADARAIVARAIAAARGRS